MKLIDAINEVLNEKNAKETKAKYDFINEIIATLSRNFISTVSNETAVEQLKCIAECMVNLKNNGNKDLNLLFAFEIDANCFIDDVMKVLVPGSGKIIGNECREISNYFEYIKSEFGINVKYRYVYRLSDGRMLIEIIVAIPKF